MSKSHRDKALTLSGRSIVPAQIYICMGRRVRAPDSAEIDVLIRNALQVDSVTKFLGREAMKLRRNWQHGALSVVTLDTIGGLLLLIVLRSAHSITEFSIGHWLR